MHLSRYIPNRSMTLIKVVFETLPNTSLFPLSPVLRVNQMQHDSTRTHTSKIICSIILKLVFLSYGNRRLSSNSLDLNLMDYGVCDDLGALGSASVSRPEELKARIAQCWEVFTKTTIIKVIDLLGICLRKCIKAEASIF